MCPFNHLGGSFGSNMNDWCWIEGRRSQEGVNPKESTKRHWRSSPSYPSYPLASLHTDRTSCHRKHPLITFFWHRISVPLRQNMFVSSLILPMDLCFSQQTYCKSKAIENGEFWNRRRDYHQTDWFLSRLNRTHSWFEVWRWIVNLS